MRAPIQRATEAGVTVDGEGFGADMRVALVNDGPVGLWIQA